MPGAVPETVTDDAVDVAAGVLGPLAERDVPLAPMTTYRVGGPAALHVRVDRPEDLTAVGRACAASGLPPLVIGRGSNLLVADAGFRGIAISLGAFADRIDIDETSATVVAGAAVRLPVLARRTASAGLTGFEWAVGVPGSIGGAVRMNAGGHGSDMAASLVEVEIFDLVAGDHPRRVPAEELGLRFRGSDVAAADVVLAARLRLAPGDVERSEAAIKEIVAWRRAHQPGGQNAGSVFVNPVPGEITAGRLIDECGLRGHRLGTAVVSEVHANFIQADEDGRADDVLELMRHVRSVVAERTGHLLRSEIRLVGVDGRW